MAVIAVGELRHGDAFLVGLNQKRGAVLVGAGNHEHICPGHALVAGENIRGHAKTSHVSNMTGTVGIGPGHVDKHIIHGFLAYQALSPVIGGTAKPRRKALSC